RRAEAHIACQRLALLFNLMRWLLALPRFPLLFPPEPFPPEPATISSEGSTMGAGSRLLSTRRSLRGRRQLIRGSITAASIRSRYFIATFISESSRESESRCGCKPSSISFECFALYSAPGPRLADRRGDRHRW